MDDFSSELDEIFSRASGSMTTLKINASSGVTETRIPAMAFHALVSLTVRGHPVVLDTPSLTRFTFDGYLEQGWTALFLIFLSRCPKLQELTVTHGEVSEENVIDEVKLDDLRTYTDITNSSRSSCHDLRLYRRLSFPEKAVRSLVFRQELPNPNSGYSTVPIWAKPQWLSIKTTRSQDDLGKDYAEGVMEIKEATTGSRFSSVMRSYLLTTVNSSYARGCVSFGAGGCKALYVEGITNHSETVLSSLWGLETLVLSCNTATSFLHALISDFERGLRCSRLKSIVIRDQYGGGKKILELLVEIAQERRSLRYPGLQSVHFLSSTPWEQMMVRRLRSLVGREVHVAKEGDALKGWNVDEKTLEILTRRVD